MPLTQRGRDSFSDTAGVDLGVHTPDEGTGWIPILDLFEISVSGIRLRANGVSLAKFDPVGSTPNNQLLRVTGGASLTGPTEQFAVACRLTGVASDFSDISGYWMQEDTAGDMTLYSVTNGSFSVIGSAAADPNDPAGTVYEISADGTSIVTTSGGGTIHSVTNGTWSSGDVALYCGGAAPEAYDEFYLFEITVAGQRFLLTRF